MSLYSICINAQTYSRKTDLPHLYINTFNRASITSKDVYIYCTLIYVDENDVVTQYDSVSIRGRGNSTWNLSKKPYKIKFKEKQKFLGKEYANAKKWTLLANAGDKTLIRNALTSELAKWMGMDFAPAAKFVDLTLNGTYQGNYQISDQVEVKNHRVNIAEQDYPLTESSNITGGYLLEVDGFKDGNWFSSSKSVAIRITYPDEDEIASTQNNYIKNYVNSFEKALFSTTYKDPTNGYRHYVDSISLANLYLVIEITGNIDGFWSLYFYKNQNDSLLYFGPPWDYDIAYNNDYRIQPTQNKLMVDEGYGDAKTWFRQMWNDAEWFSKLINKRYQVLLDNGIEQFLYHKIDSLTQLLEQSQKQNYSRWSIRTRMYHEIVTHSSYEEYIDDLKSFIHEHLAFLETAFANRLPQEPTPPFEPKAFYYNILNAKTNKPMDIFATDGVAYDDTNKPEPGALLCTWTLSDSRPAQYWKIEKVGDYFTITNQLGLALNDPTIGQSTATTNVGTQLNLVNPNPNDDRQLWVLTPQGTQGYYNITNVYTNHTANLNGGNAANGTSVISYTTDNRNETSTNRLWYIKKTTVRLPDSPILEPVFNWDFVQGWNWGAHVMEQIIDTDVFKNDASHIVAQNYEAFNDPEFGFSGSLISLKPATLYKFFMNENVSYSFVGNFCDNNLPIPIKPGWNWIGFTLLQPTALNETLSKEFASDGDIILGLDGFSIFSDNEWNGTLTELTPAHGYMYFTSDTKSIRFFEPNNKTKRRVNDSLFQNKHSDNEEGDIITIDQHAFPNVMGVIATIRNSNTNHATNINNNIELFDDIAHGRSIICAFDNDGKCRGLGKPVNGCVFISIHGNNGEKISFKVIDRNNNSYHINETLNFTSDVLGDPNLPVVLTLTDAEITSKVELVSKDSHCADKHILGYYSISGVYVAKLPNNLPSGIYIVKYSDGTTSKILIDKSTNCHFY